MGTLDLMLPQGGTFWRNWVTEHSTLVYFCEPATEEAFFRQKIDTYTNLGFFFYAMLMFAFARADRETGKTGFAIVHPIWSIGYGVAMLLTFAGSTFFHASLTLSGEALDLAGVYAAVLLPVFFNFHRIGTLRAGRRIGARPFLIGWGVLWIVTSLLIFRLSSRVVVPSALVLIGVSGFILWLKVHPRRGWWFAGSSIALTAVAATFFVMDIQKIGCAPGSWYQAHGIWHLLSASAAAAYYGFMRKLH